MKEHELTHKWKIDIYDSHDYGYLCTAGILNVYHNTYVYDHYSGLPFCFYKGQRYTVNTNTHNEHFIYVNADIAGIPSTMPIASLSTDKLIDHEVKRLCVQFELFLMPTHRIDRFTVVDAWGNAMYECMGIRKIYKELRTKKGLYNFSVQMGQTFGL